MSKATNDIVQTVIDYRQYSHKFKQRRQRRNNFNWDMYNYKQDYSHKRRGQSKEFIPKLAIAVEHLVSTILTGLTNRSDDWFAVTKGRQEDDIITTDAVQAILSYHLYNTKAYVAIANAIKNVGMDSICIAKVHGNIRNERRLMFERGREVFTATGDRRKIKSKVEEKEIKRWSLAIDIIDFEDFYFDPEPNPTGPLFEIHTVKRDLHELMETSKDFGVYDMTELKKVEEEFQLQEQEENKRRRKDLPDYTSLAFRRKVTLTECWGTILDRGTGKAKERNMVATICNDKYLIRPPEKNPNRDFSTPFVYSPLIEVPGSPYGKGLFDPTASQNKTLNESANLLIDGLFDTIKGIKQFRKGLLTRPSQASGGLVSGMTLEIDEATPGGVFAVEKVRTGEVPPDAFQFHRYLEELCNESALKNELTQGGLPPSSTKATVAAISDQSIQGLFAGLSRMFEDNWVTPVLEKSWLQILQNMDEDEFAEEELVSLIGPDKAAKLVGMSIDERYARGAFVAKFRVRGISAILQRVREYGKLVNALQVISSNPDLYAEFKRKFSVERVLSNLLSNAGIREDELKLTEDEIRTQQTKDSVGQLMSAALSGIPGGSSSTQDSRGISAESGRSAKNIPQSEGEPGQFPLMEGNA